MGKEADCSRCDEQNHGVETLAAPSVTAVFDVLANKRRRYLLRYLTNESDRTTTVDDFVDYLVERNSLTTPEEREIIVIQLHHQHLPKMADAGIINYDDRDGTIRYYENQLVEECLATVAGWDLS